MQNIRTPTRVLQENGRNGGVNQAVQVEQLHYHIFKRGFTKGRRNISGLEIEIFLCTAGLSRPIYATGSKNRRYDYILTAFGRKGRHFWPVNSALFRLSDSATPATRRLPFTSSVFRTVFIPDLQAVAAVSPITIISFAQYETEYKPTIYYNITVLAFVSFLVLFIIIIIVVCIFCFSPPSHRLGRNLRLRFLSIGCVGKEAEVEARGESGMQETAAADGTRDQGQISVGTTVGGLACVRGWSLVNGQRGSVFETDGQTLTLIFYRTGQKPLYAYIYIYTRRRLFLLVPLPRPTPVGQYPRSVIQIVSPLSSKSLKFLYILYILLYILYTLYLCVHAVRTLETIFYRIVSSAIFSEPNLSVSPSHTLSFSISPALSLSVRLDVALG